jgi:hypothetical protein
MKKMMLVLSVMISHSMSHGVGKVVQVLNRSDMPWMVRVNAYKSGGHTPGACLGSRDEGMIVDSKAIGKFPFEETESCNLNIGNVRVFNKDNDPALYYAPDAGYEQEGKKAVKHFIVDTKQMISDSYCPAPVNISAPVKHPIEGEVMTYGGEVVPCQKASLVVSITPVTEKEFNTAVKDFEAKIKSKLKIQNYKKNK